MKLNIFQRLAFSHGVLILLSLLGGLMGLWLFGQAIDNYQAVAANYRTVQAAQEA